MTEDERPSLMATEEKEKGTSALLLLSLCFLFLDKTCSLVKNTECLQFKTSQFSLKYSISKREPLIKVNS